MPELSQVARGLRQVNNALTTAPILSTRRSNLQNKSSVFINMHETSWWKDHGQVYQRHIATCSYASYAVATLHTLSYTAYQAYQIYRSYRSLIEVIP